MPGEGNSRKHRPFVAGPSRLRKMVFDRRLQKGTSVSNPVSASIDGGHSEEDTLNDLNNLDKVLTKKGKMKLLPFFANFEENKTIQEFQKNPSEYEGKIYNLCCSMCVKDFKKNAQKYMLIVDEELSARKISSEPAAPIPHP